MGWLQSITGLVNLVLEIIRGAKALADWVEANKTEAWFQQSAESFKKLREAKTPEEKRNVAKELRDLIRGL